jgi:anti-sigma regulatory factor (Ser/Thr protein kinase)/putative methionine-R-sulfoxide reductase with GAF domain
MALERMNTARTPPRAGQVVLPPAAPHLAPSSQVRALYRLGDPALSELGVEEFLAELLIRVREALSVDTVAILLLDRETNELVARAAKGIEEEVEQGVRLPIGRGFAGRIAAERVAIFIEDVNHADILNPILREKGIRSLLGVPLVVEGEVIGVLHVGSLHPRVFGERDLSVLQIAAARAAPGIERARLFSALEHEHRLATALQRSLLPSELIDVAGVSVAARYLPAADEVGGDWYDVFELPRGKIGAAIGDVVGHGIQAAALMGQLRTALHAYAMEGHPPGRTLELVDRFVQGMPRYAMATAIYAVFDPDTNALTVANCGHLPPIIVGQDSTRILEIEPNAPLGAFPYGRCHEHELTLGSGETLVLYTDGLIERRNTSLTGSIDRLCAVVSDAGSAEAVCELALDHLVPFKGAQDDVAILALEITDVARDLCLRLPARPDVLAGVRRVIRRWLRDLGAGAEDISEITLAVSEACANAIEHAYSPAPAHFDVEATCEEGTATITIHDRGRWRQSRGMNRGRGLSIIETVMDDVAIESTADGTSIVMTRRLRR